MAARRLILALLVLLVISTILVNLVPVEDRLGDETSTKQTTTPERPHQPAAGKLIVRRIATDDATPERIELGRGDQLQLTVTSPKLADQVEIPAFGDTEEVDPDFPARFDLLALETGSFPVRLVEADRVIARIDVGAGQAEGDRSNDSPGRNNASSDSGASAAS